MDGLEFRYAGLEVRDAGAVVEGIAMPYGTTARIMDVFDETVEPGAFKFDDVVLNRMHVREDLLARTGGGGLVLTDSASHLALRADIPKYREDIRDQVARRILRGFSVEMRVTAEDWPSPDKRIIRAAEVRGIGLVDRPAYGEATATIAKRVAHGGGGIEVRWWPLAV